MLALPLFVSVAGWYEGVPTSCEPKLREDGVRLAIGDATVYTPVCTLESAKPEEEHSASIVVLETAIGDE